MGKIKQTKIINRYYTAILYEEDTNFKNYMKNIIDNFEEVTWVVHDRDIKEDGSLKKRHVHILFKVGENARHRKAIAKIIGCEENMLEGCNKNATLMYLIHLNNPEKTQYDIEEVQGELKEKLRELKEKTTDIYIRYSKLLEAIKQDQIQDEEDLLSYCVENKLLDILKNNQYILCQMIKKRSCSLRSGGHIL